MSNNLGRTPVSASQGSSIFNAIENSDGLCDAAITGAFTLAVDSTSETLTDAQFRQNSMFFLTVGSPAPGGGVTLTVPAISRGMFVVKNDCGQTVTVQHSGASPAGPTVASGAVAIFFTDGATVYKV